MPRTYHYALADVETHLWITLFLLGALLATVMKAYLGLDQARDAEPMTVFVFGPGEPEQSAQEARRRKQLEEQGPLNMEALREWAETEDVPGQDAA